MSLLSEDPASVDRMFMLRALTEAEKAARAGEVPVGAVLVHGGKVIARAHNQRETLNDPTAHAEMIALTQAAAALEEWRLVDVTAYVTLEPCPMCAGAFVQARIARVVFGAYDPKGGACGTLYELHDDERLNHRFSVTGGVLEDECRTVLQEFFHNRREQQKEHGRGAGVVERDGFENR